MGNEWGVEEDRRQEVEGNYQNETQPLVIKSHAHLDPVGVLNSNSDSIS